jgi:predicted anti-sigma-YlaC factor YlaD
MTALTCREVVELVTDYLENALTPEDRARFNEHLALCPGCDSYL